MDHPSSRPPIGLRVIGAVKVLSGLSLILLGFGIFRLLDRDLGELIERWVERLPLDRRNRQIHAVIASISGVHRKQLQLIGVGTFFYAVLHLVEGFGLILRRHWAEYLTVVATSLLIPLELYEVVTRTTFVRLGVIAANAGVVVYLLWRLRLEHRNGGRRALD